MGDMYTTRDFLIQTRMTVQSGLPADEIVNDFAVRFIDNPTQAELTQVMSDVGNFFSAGAVQNDRVGTWISGWVNRGATHRIAAYQIVDGPLGSPEFEMNWLGPSANADPNSLPQELAACLSFHADLTGYPEEAGPTHPKARRRGRIYVGPLTSTAVDTGQFAARLAGPFTLALRARGGQMGRDILSHGAEWCVWSRAAQDLYPVVAGWTDDAPDTQRRRGVAPTARIVFAV